MQVILLEKIRNLGTIGDKVNVKPGFARNFLIPYSKAIAATAENLIKFEARRAELEKSAAEAALAAQERAKRFDQLTLTISARASEEGKLFGSIGTREIVKAFQKAGHEVAKSEIILSEGSIRQIGEYTLTLQLGSDVIATVKVSVIPEAAAE